MAKILIVDPDAIMRQMIANVLDAEGHKIIGVGDPMTALERIQHLSFDLIISAINMEPHTGVWLSKRLARNNVRVKMAFLCEDGAVAGVLKQTLGFKAVIKVPFKPAELLRRVRSLLGGR